MDLRVAFETFFSLGFCGLVLLLASGLIWQSPPEVRQVKPEVSSAYYPVLIVLFAIVGVMLWPHIHWDRVAALIGGGR
jgi:hypothetical protein